MVVPPENDENFMFAFNDPDYSDRVLRLEIVPNESKSSNKRKKRKNPGSHDGAEVVPLHINSAILAKRSRFFRKLFKSGMKESQQKSDVSLTISECEKVPLMDLLSFIYENKLSATSVTDLVDLLMAADKFEVSSCMRYAIQMLLNIPMSLENAFLYLELPPSVSMSEIVQPLIDEAKKYVFAQYTDFTKFKEEAMELPLSAVEVVLEREGLRVDSEDDVCDFILEWARAHYPELEERREILTKHLVHLICFPNMSSSKLKEVLASPDFDHEQVSKLVMEALFSKVELPCGQHVHATNDLVTTNCNFSGRVYKPRCVVYFDLKKKVCASLFPAKHLKSSEFCLGSKRLYLSAACCKGGQQRHFGLFLRKVRGSVTLDYEFAAFKKSSKEFEIVLTRKNRTFNDSGWGSSNLLSISWADFMSDACDYFVDGFLHLRAEIALVNNS